MTIRRVVGIGLLRQDTSRVNALDLLARDSMRDFQELADEAFADLLHKHIGTP